MDHKAFLASLETGERRVAQKVGADWVVDAEVKQQILEVFRSSEVIDMPGGFRDKAPLVPRIFTSADAVRLVPGGTAVRAGAHVGKDVVIMPPSYINIGAYVDEGAMVDHHVLVGSCAQIGKRVHLSTAVQIGGVLEPVGNRPVIVEDDCFIGAGVILTEGVLVRQRAVLAPGVSLSAAVPIYDLVRQEVYKGVVPENAVVVPGSRPVSNNSWAKDLGLCVGCAIIVKYRDDKTNNALVLEDALR